MVALKCCYKLLKFGYYFVLFIFCCIVVDRYLYCMNLFKYNYIFIDLTIR